MVCTVRLHFTTTLLHSVYTVFTQYSTLLVQYQYSTSTRCVYSQRNLLLCLHPAEHFVVRTSSNTILSCNTYFILFYVYLCNIILYKTWLNLKIISSIIYFHLFIKIISDYRYRNTKCGLAIMVQ